MKQEMKQLVPWFAIGLSMVALTVSLWPTRVVVAEKVILKDKNGVVRAILDADRNVLVSLFSEDNKEMLRITALSDGAQIDMHGPDARQRVRLSTWGSNYLSIMDESWNNRIEIGDLVYQDDEGNWKTRMGGIAFEKDGKQEVVFQIPE